MEDLETTDRPNDAPGVQVIKLKNNVVYLKKTDPFGHWTVNFDKGQMPERLQGAYLSDVDARRAVMDYLRQKGRLEEVA